MYRVSLYLSRFLRRLSHVLYVMYDTAEDQQSLALQNAKTKRQDAAAARLSAAKDAAESAKARLTVAVERFKEEAKLIKEMI